MGKQDFRYFVGYKILKKLDLYAYSVHKWLYIKETLMKINILIFKKKVQKVFIKYMKITEKVGNVKNKSGSKLIKAQKGFY